jgi:hypothetical protein
MTLKNAALLALIGTTLMTALLLWTFVSTFLNVLQGLVPAATLFQSLIHAFGCFSMMEFFFVFHRAQLVESMAGLQEVSGVNWVAAVLRCHRQNKREEYKRQTTNAKLHVSFSV